MQLSRSDIARARREFWADKAANVTVPGPGLLERRAMARTSAAQALWKARYDAACQPLVVSIKGN